MVQGADSLTNEMTSTRGMLIHLPEFVEFILLINVAGFMEKHSCLTTEKTTWHLQMLQPSLFPEPSIRS